MFYKTVILSKLAQARSKCPQAVNDPSFPFQNCEFPCNSFICGTFPLTGSIIIRRTIEIYVTP